ncbi:secretion protein HlyD [Jeongeupia sp. USM3]|nr:secretion protein HlyD [Jeongeupia sp. USM3]
MAVLALAVLAGCGGPASPTWQGYVEGEYVYVATSQPGRLERLSVERGQQVSAGQPLFALESADEAAAQRQASAQLASAQAQLADLGTGKRPAEIDVTRAQLVQAQAEAVRAAAELARVRGLVGAGAVSRQQLDQATAGADATAALVRQLQSQLQVDVLAGRSQQIRAQAAQVAAAQAALAQADWLLGQKTVVAPRGGLVDDTLYRAGEWVAAGRPVLRLLPPENVKVRFFVPQTVLGGLKLGQPVRLRCDGCPAPVSAKISYISAAAEYTPPVIYSNDTRDKLVFMLEARPAAADAPRLHPGQPVEVVPDG